MKEKRQFSHNNNNNNKRKKFIIKLPNPPLYNMYINYTHSKSIQRF